MKDIIFNNVTIVIHARSPKAAYRELCKRLGDICVEYNTDTYAVYDPIEMGYGPEKPTRELFPNPGATE